MVEESWRDAYMWDHGTSMAYYQNIHKSWGRWLVVSGCHTLYQQFGNSAGLAGSKPVMFLGSVVIVNMFKYWLISNFFLQKSSVKTITLEQAVKLIQIAERARQGRLRALFMKQIFLQEYRARQARLLGERVADVAAAALRIQKVRRDGEGSQPWGSGVWHARDAYQGAVSSETQNSKILPLVQPDKIPERLIFLPWGNH